MIILVQDIYESILIACLFKIYMVQKEIVYVNNMEEIKAQ